MSTFIALPPKERLIFLQQAAIRTGYSAVVLEKDAWVCWTLKTLFSLQGIAQSLTFKGGTSLSKAYGVIDRFSEDIDITIDKAVFGLKTEDLEALSGTAREKALEGVAISAATFVREELLPKLSLEIKTDLTEKWRLEIDPEDPLSLLFYFPSVLPEGEFRYITRNVKLEFGTRADTWPSEQRSISSYLSQAFPESFSEDRETSIAVLSVERTFWEKSTILHAEYHRPEGKQIQLRTARHFYDLYCLGQSEHGLRAIENLSLLERVAQHKSIFFRAGWAKYNEARPGTLRLVPREFRQREFEHDYILMREMFLSVPPDFAVIIIGLQNLENKINQRKP